MFACGAQKRLILKEIGILVQNRSKFVKKSPPKWAKNVGVDFFNFPKSKKNTDCRRGVLCQDRGLENGTVKKLNMIVRFGSK